jgi:hypothetical protein
LVLFAIRLFIQDLISNIVKEPSGIIGAVEPEDVKIEPDLALFCSELYSSSYLQCSL